MALTSVCVMPVHRSSSSIKSSSRCRQKTTPILRPFLIALAGAILVSQEESCFATSRELTPHLELNVAERVNVYIYDDPVFDNAALIECYRDHFGGVAPWQDERTDMAQDMGEIWLHQSLLSHPWRVLDPEDADVFFVPLYAVLDYKVIRARKSCGGLERKERVTRSINHLIKNSPYFNRFGGADHIVVCAWWNCGRLALNPQHRMLLRRTVVGINEKLDMWSLWGCGGRMVTVPYTASSVLSTPELIGGLSWEEKDIPFSFVGTARRRPERENLEVVKHMSPNSLIELGDNGKVWGEGPSVFADNMARSRFCFCPRGDTISSRRIFDAVAAGCIPVITAEELNALPFLRTGLNYSEFAVVAEKGTFGTAGQVVALAEDLSSRSDDQLATLHEGLVGARSSILYGISTGPDLADMEPFHGTASRFLLEVQALLGNGGLWSCPPKGGHEKRVSPRTAAEFPPPEGKRKQWLHESETIVNVEHSLLFCAPPNTGSLQFRMLAKRMKGVGHWLVSNDRSLLFDAVASELPLLDWTNKPLMEDIYKKNRSGWIKIGVVRDPVTRLLSAYLDLARNWPSEAAGASSPDQLQEQPHRQLLMSDGWEWFDAIRRHRGLELDEAEQQQPNAEDSQRSHTWPEDDEGRGMRGSGDGSRSLQDGAVPPVPTFEELLELLKPDIWAAPSAFRPAASLCGMWQSPFDTIIPFETLQHTSTKVLKSLPGDIWQHFGESGWGPEGKHAFMEFDYGTVSRHDTFAVQAPTGYISKDMKGTKNNPIASARARHLFSGDSCAWTEYYSDHAILDKVGLLYGEDFELFAWYDIKGWHQRLEACLNRHE